MHDYSILIPGTEIEMAWAILMLPLLSAIVIGLFTRGSRKVSTALSCGAILLGLAITLLYAAKIVALGAEIRTLKPLVQTFRWLSFGGGTMDIGIQIDALSVCMLFVVTGVGSLIHIYSIGYMDEDAGYSRYFAKLSLFTFSMLGIVLSTNFVQIFIFWELVGVSSYLLIGFWFHKPSAIEAAKKAFITNRVGDFGFLLGILLLYFAMEGARNTVLPGGGIVEAGGSLDFVQIERWMKHYASALVADWKGAAGALLIFCGAVGKSAQVPLQVWLPDAMEGPTPVSALMHAATMVAAGVYMLVRVFFIFEPFPDAMLIVAWIGGITAIMAATMAFVQFDIKRVLAYSTLSQLGYMVMAVGMGVDTAAGTSGPTAAMFHLTTHAFFKALLFLGAGAVIVACHHEQDMRHMGGLRTRMPITFWTFIAGTLALAGIPPLAGFWSKDEILAAAHHSPGLFAIAVITAGMTACYMGRLVFMTFFGSYRGHGEHVHEVRPVMWVPLVVLAVLSVGAGFATLPERGFRWFLAFGREMTAANARPAPYHFHWDVATIGTAAGLIGIVVSWLIYQRRVVEPARVAKALGPIYSLAVNKFYFDVAYQFLVKKVQQGVAVAMNWIEQVVLIKGIVNNVADGTREAGNRLRRFQTGRLPGYVFIIAAGVVLVVFISVVARTGS